MEYFIIPYCIKDMLVTFFAIYCISHLFATNCFISLEEDGLVVERNIDNIINYCPELDILIMILLGYLGMLLISIILYFDSI